MSQLEPTTQAFIDSLAGATPIFTLSPEAARNVLAGAQKSVSVTLAPARSDDRILNVGPKGRKLPDLPAELAQCRRAMHKCTTPAHASSGFTTGTTCILTRTYSELKSELKPTL
jgi:hypothetical protein